MATWKEVASRFVESEIWRSTYEKNGPKSDPSKVPDFQAFARTLLPFSPEDRAKAWWYVVTEIDDVKYPEVRIKCYIEQLYNDPTPASVSWDWLAGKYNPAIKVLPPGSPRTHETIVKLRKQLGSFGVDSEVSVQTQQEASKPRETKGKTPEQGDRGRAEALYEKAMDCMESGGLKKDAIRLLKEAITADPTYPEAYDGLADVYTSMGHADQAIAAMRTCGELKAKERAKNKKWWQFWK